MYYLYTDLSLKELVWESDKSTITAYILYILPSPTVMRKNIQIIKKKNNGHIKADNTSVENIMGKK